MPEHAVSLRAADGSALEGLWRLPEGPGPFPCVACISGLTLSRGLFDDPAEALEARGVASLRLDLRGHGASGGVLKEQGFLDELSDVMTAFEGLGTLPGADASRRGLLGFSLGGALSALNALKAPVKALALWSPLLSTGPWDSARREQYGPPQDGYQPIWDGILVSERLFSEAQGFDPLAAANAFAGPFLVCHGGKDRNHPQGRSLELAASRAAAARPVASYFPPFSGHQWRNDPERRLRDALTAAFFATVL